MGGLDDGKRPVVDLPRMPKKSGAAQPSLIALIGQLSLDC